MKRFLLLITVLTVSTSLMAQTDSSRTKQNGDTIRVGNFVIIKKHGSKNVNSTIGNDEKKANKKKNISTNWWIVDLGFANFRDETNYAAAQSSGYLKATPNTGVVNANSMKLNTGKSSNFNIWFFMQKLNVSKNILNLKYGFGVESYNFRYDGSLSYRKNGNNSYVFNDSINFSKNKLMAAYLTVPFMVNINATPQKKNGLSFSAGVSAGYLFKSRNKQVSDERGKVKYNGNFDLQPFRLAAIGEIGIGSVRLFGSYSLNALHNKSTMLEQYPYSVGIRLSSW